MEAGIAEHAWALAETVGLLEAVDKKQHEQTPLKIET
jgi:hypothetical protein